MSFDFSICNEEQLWKYVASHLRRRGIDSVLVGGSVVAIYSEGVFQSGDLDLIISSLFARELPAAMAEIGFAKQGRHYVHPDCSHLLVEFPPGPLAIGDDYKLAPAKRMHEGVEIKILSPTDCIKDRLASYIHFKSRDTLEQAVLVAKRQPFKLAEIKRWCSQENSGEVFEDFCSLVAKK